MFKKIFLFVFPILFLLTCTRVQYVNKFVFPPAPDCPKVLKLTMDKTYANMTEKEKAHVMWSNIAKAERLGLNKLTIIECYERYFDELKKLKLEQDKETEDGK